MRNLLNRSFEQLGVDQKVWLSLETGGYGDAATGGQIPAATGAIEHSAIGIKFNIPREDSPSRSGRSLVTRLSGKKEVDVSFEGHIIPGDPDGSNHPTLPPMHPLLLSAFGIVDQTDVTKVVYRLARLSSNSFRMLEEATHYTRLATGCVMDKMTFTLPGDGKAMVKAEGFGQDVYVAGEATVSVTQVGGGQTFPVANGKGQLFELGSLIDIVDMTDGTTYKTGPNGRKVTLVTPGTLSADDIVTVDGAALPALNSGDIVCGHAPSTYAPLMADKALLGLKGSFTVAGLSVANELTSAEISITNNFTKKNFVYGTSKITGYVPDKRRAISVKLEVLLNKDNFVFYVRNKQFVAEDITITLEPQDIPAPLFTSSLGRTFEFHMPRVEFNIPSIDQPGDKYVTLALEGVAMASDVNNLDTELTLTIR
jgi:hypothetical protein